MCLAALLLAASAAGAANTYLESDILIGTNTLERGDSIHSNFNGSITYTDNSFFLRGIDLHVIDEFSKDGMGIFGLRYINSPRASMFYLGSLAPLNAEKHSFGMDWGGRFRMSHFVIEPHLVFGPNFFIVDGPLGTQNFENFFMELGLGFRWLAGPLRLGFYTGFQINGQASGGADYNPVSNRYDGNRSFSWSPDSISALAYFSIGIPVWKIR